MDAIDFGYCIIPYARGHIRSRVHKDNWGNTKYCKQE